MRWDSILPDDRHYCLGVQLEHLTLGHLFLLHKYENTSLEARLGSLVLSAFICSQPWRDAAKNVKRSLSAVYVALWGWKARNLNIVEEQQAFEQYIRESLSPIRTKHPSDARSLACEVRWRMMASATILMGLGSEEALDTPVSVISATTVAHFEREGKLDVWSEDDDDLLQFAREQDQIWLKARENSTN